MARVDDSQIVGRVDTALVEASNHLHELYQEFRDIPAVNKQARNDKMYEMNETCQQLNLMRRHPLAEEQRTEVTDEVLTSIANGREVDHLGHYFLSALMYKDRNGRKIRHRREQHEHNFSDMNRYGSSEPLDQEKLRNMATTTYHHDDVHALQEAIIKAIQHLETPYLTIFVDRLKGLSDNDIAIDHGLPEGTVKRRVHTIRTLLSEIPHAFPDDCEHADQFNNDDKLELLKLTTAAVQKIVNDRTHGYSEKRGRIKPGRKTPAEPDTRDSFKR